MKTVPFNTLVGEIITKVEGLKKHSDEITFTTASGRKFLMNHHQDCCESVSLEDYTGDEDDLLNTPVLSAEESTSDEQQPDIKEADDWSFTWTFYRITTAKGQVVLRWLGESNGYYGEGVDFEEVIPS